MRESTRISVRLPPSTLLRPIANLPGYIHISKRGLNDSTAAFLGARHAELRLEGDKPPENLAVPPAIDESADEAREQLRVQFNRRFSQQRSRALTDVYNSSYDQAAKLMKRKAMFEGDGSGAGS